MLLKDKSHHVAFGGILAALALLFLIMSSAIPVGRLVFVFLASSMIGIGVNMFSIRFSAVVYAVSAILGLFIVPEKTYAVLYVVVVGNYPLLKPLLERTRSVPLRLTLKLVIFNAYMLVCWLIAVYLLNIPMNAGYPVWMLWLMMLAAFFVYDYAYSLFMQKIYYALPKNKF